MHTHAPVIDGVFGDDGSGQLEFHPAAPPTAEERHRVLTTIARRVDRQLGRRGMSDDGHRDEDPFVAATLLLAGLTAASIDGRTATGPRAGAQVRRAAQAPGSHRRPNGDASAPPSRYSGRAYRTFAIDSDPVRRHDHGAPGAQQDSI